jgi:hypothetical protein
MYAPIHSRRARLFVNKGLKDAEKTQTQSGGNLGDQMVEALGEMIPPNVRREVAANICRKDDFANRPCQPGFVDPRKYAPAQQGSGMIRSDMSRRHTDNLKIMGLTEGGREEQQEQEERSRGSGAHLSVEDSLRLVKMMSDARQKGRGMKRGGALGGVYASLSGGFGGGRSSKRRRF